MAVTTTKTNKPLNPRGNDQSPKGYNRAELFSGKALDFDGVNDQIDITTNDLDFGANDFSVTAIVNWTGAYADGKLAYAEKNNSGSALAAWQIRTDPNGSLLFQANIDGLGWVAVTYVDVLDILAKGLTHLTFVRVGTGASLYINGQFYSNGTGSIGATLDTPNGDFVIGNRIGSSNYWNGLITQYKVFSTALTAAQVADLYNNPEKIVPTGVEDSALKLWLPMQEGAGTTAYDGSGNGNHGTISGATYTHGVGAPVSQTAVISWNKGVNLLDEYSEDFSNSGWTKTGSSISASSESNPYGKQTWEFEVTSLPSEVQVRGNISGSTPSSTAFKSFVIAKAGTLDWLRVRNLFVTGGGTSGNVWFNLSTGSVGSEQSSQTGTMTDLGNGWYKCEVSGTTAAAIPNYLFDVGFTDTDNTNEPTATGGTGLLVLSAFSLNGIYVETLSSAQTSDVLLPQGLTTGRDITGVNLFENVRKQGALNLDGNSWAEVHDNESLDITDAITLEAWVYWDSAASDDGILGRWGSISAEQNYMLYAQSINNARFYINNSSISATISNGWNHFVGTYDKTTMKFYVNGSLQNSVANTAAITTSDKPIEIGRYYHGATAGTRLYSNDIAQPRIYNRALTASEVQKNYNAGKNTYTN